jgi:hypothetical protein
MKQCPASLALAEKSLKCYWLLHLDHIFSGGYSNSWPSWRLALEE